MIPNDMTLKILLYGGILFIFSERSAPARAPARARRAHHTCALHPQHNQSLLALIIARRFNPKHNVALIASRGPKRNMTYDPHYGYEPYWPAGEWVYKPYKVDKHICGVYKCAILYQLYGVICARNKRDERETFENYCEMLAKDCNGTEGWTLLSKGNCTENVKTFQIDYTVVMGNVPVYLAEYKQRINISLAKFREQDALKLAMKRLKNLQYRDKGPNPGPQQVDSGRR